MRTRNCIAAFIAGLVVLLAATGAQAENIDLLEALDRLAEQQQRIYRITRDLQLGRNR